MSEVRIGEFLISISLLRLLQRIAPPIRYKWETMKGVGRCAFVTGQPDNCPLIENHAARCRCILLPHPQLNVSAELRVSNAVLVLSLRSLFRLVPRTTRGTKGSLVEVAGGTQVGWIRSWMNKNKRDVTPVGLLRLQRTAKTVTSTDVGGADRLHRHVLPLRDSGARRLEEHTRDDAQHSDRSVFTKAIHQSSRSSRCRMSSPDQQSTFAGQCSLA